MTGFAEASLAIMAAALVLMALAQVAVALAAVRVARQAIDATRQLQATFGPCSTRSTGSRRMPSRRRSSGSRRLERVDQVVRSTAQRIEETVAKVQTAVVEPVQHGAALVAGFLAGDQSAPQVRRGQRVGGPAGSARSRDEDEDALFIG